MGRGVVVVGSSNTDMAVRGPVLPRRGETVVGGEFFTGPGGKGANQAVAAARLGASVTLVARLGADVFGEQALEGYRREGICVDFIVRDTDRPSGVALILVDQNGENMISVASGANSALSRSDVEAAETAISGASVMLLQLEIPTDAVCRAAELARASGVTVILNPAPARELPQSLLRNVTILTPNEKETETLAGVLPKDADSASQAAQALMEKGVENVAITLGESGVFLATRKETLLIPGIQVDAVDATAAGDAFNGALACALAGGDSLHDAAVFANAVAALTVTRLGAQDSLPTRAELATAASKLPVLTRVEGFL